MRALRAGALFAARGDARVRVDRARPAFDARPRGGGRGPPRFLGSRIRWRRVDGRRSDAGAAADGRGDAGENDADREDAEAGDAKRAGLAALRPVPGVVLARDALIARVKDHVDREVPPEAIRHEGVELQIFGFVPTSFDYEKVTFELLQAQLAGFYEPADGTMYMAADLNAENADATLSHELVHALQDQHFDLKPHSKYEAGKSDAQTAFSALAEGDATSAMADVMIADARPGATALDLPDELFVEQVNESVNSGPAATAPHIMRTSLVAPYVYGTIFVNALRRSGGWPAVDATWKAMPTTSEQILHVEKWRAHEPALAVSPPTFAALGPGWSAVDEDTSGELGLRLAFEEWMGAGEAEGGGGRVGGRSGGAPRERRSRGARDARALRRGSARARRGAIRSRSWPRRSRRTWGSRRRRTRTGCASNGPRSGRSRR